MLLFNINCQKLNYNKIVLHVYIFTICIHICLYKIIYNVINVKYSVNCYTYIEASYIYYIQHFNETYYNNTPL